MSRFLSERLMNVTPYTPGEQPQDQKYICLLYTSDAADE